MTDTYAGALASDDLKILPDADPNRSQNLTHSTIEWINSREW